jgi:secreted trypsin-like serine protease
MNKSFITVLAFVTLFFSQTFISANAMENGFDAPLDGRTVSISAEPMGIVCTGFLYTERIVLTAGHCLFNGQTKERLTNSKIGLPNETFSWESKKINASKSFLAPNWAWSDENNFNPQGEFGIYVLSEPIPVRGKVTIASKSQINNYLSQGVLITNVAYGKQTPEQDWSGYPSRTPKFAQFPLVAYETVKVQVDQALRDLGKNKYNMTIHLLQVPGGPSTCGGDSGSPFYVKEGEDFIYLGPLSNGIGGIPNCSGSPWKGDKMYIGAVEGNDYLGLIAEAEKYVADNPYVAAKAINSSSNMKKTINCSNGKISKKVSGTNPKCPKGYNKVS